MYAESVLEKDMNSLSMPLMQNRKNHFFTLSTLDSELESSVVTLLYSFPLSRTCLENLDSDMIKHLEVGFFTPGYTILHQGDSGKDLFLLCQGKVDVIVDDQRVVQMEGPVFLGEKALVMRDSTRQATIEVIEEQALLIKIPMGKYLKDVKSKDAADSDYLREFVFFKKLFIEIQQRLFEHSAIQKKLWDEVNINLSLSNSLVIANCLDQKKELNWNKDLWNSIFRYVNKELKITWPERIPFNKDTLRDILWLVLEKKITQTDKESTANFITRKNGVWKTWMTQISHHVIQQLPMSEWPVHLNDFELFNPENYHKDILKILQQVESKFADNTFSEEQYQMDHFFRKGEHTHEFDIEEYLKYFETSFQTKHPFRTKACISRHLAIVAAECENMFNHSLVEMRQFLSSVKKQFSISASTRDRENYAKIQLQKDIEVLLNAFTGVEKRFMRTADHNFKIRVSSGTAPTLNSLMHSLALKQGREKVLKCFYQILDILHMVRPNIPTSFYADNIFLCKGETNEYVPFSELTRYYWIPLSEGMCLDSGDFQLNNIPTGTVLGGPVWGRLAANESTISLKMPESEDMTNRGKAYLSLVIPVTAFPWEQELLPSTDQFNSQCVPLMQWMLTLQIDSIAYLAQNRNSIYENLTEIQHHEKMEKQIRIFESTSTMLTPDEKKRIEGYYLLGKVHTCEMTFMIQQFRLGNANDNWRNSI
ncbi:MAG: cyclic nucleotide-binding domain-containing protein, partial [SAR324 cluster bacterium]|nr:cyclic nucleotide-binding domain-containing protein [SAR324 cluster bacterium]